MTSAAKLWNTCVVCAKDATGESLIATNPLCGDMNRRVLREKKTASLYRAPQGHRMHLTCLLQLQNYFKTMESNKHAKS